MSTMVWVCAAVLLGVMFTLLWLAVAKWRRARSTFWEKDPPVREVRQLQEGYVREAADSRYVPVRHYPSEQGKRDMEDIATAIEVVGMVVGIGLLGGLFGDD